MILSASIGGVATQFIVCSVGIGDAPQQADLPKIPLGNFVQNRKVCTTLPCLPRYFNSDINNNPNTILLK